MTNQKEREPSEGIVHSAIEFSKGSLFWKFIAWLVILIVVLQLSWLSIGTITDKLFWIKEASDERTYELQIKTLDFIQGDVMAKLDTIYDRLDNVEEMDRVQNKLIEDLENRIMYLEDTH